MGWAKCEVSCRNVSIATLIRFEVLLGIELGQTGIRLAGVWHFTSEASLKLGWLDVEPPSNAACAYTLVPLSFSSVARDLCCAGVRSAVSTSFPSTEYIGNSKSRTVFPKLGNTSRTVVGAKRDMNRCAAVAVPGPCLAIHLFLGILSTPQTCLSPLQCSLNDVARGWISPDSTDTTWRDPGTHSYTNELVDPELEMLRLPSMPSRGCEG